MAGPNAEAEVHAQHLTEKAAREQLRGITINSWPHDAAGNPMAIVVGAASDLVPTVQFGNATIGPVTIMRPVSNESLDVVIEEAQQVQKAAEFVVGSERRLIQWAIDPASRVSHPTTGQDVSGAPAASGAPAETASQTTTPQPGVTVA